MQNHARSLSRALKAAASTAVLLALVPPAALGASLHRPAASSSVVTAVESGNPPSLDPALGFDQWSWSYLHATFVTPLTFNAQLKIVPWGATAMPTVTDGGLVYTFHMRTGMTFTDGEPVTAAAYALGIERMLNPATKSLLLAFYTVIQGASAYSAGKAKSVSGIKVTGASTLQVTLTKPDRTFLDIMAIPNAAAVPPKLIAKESATFGLHPVGDGPYIIKTYIPGREIVMVKNPHYFAASSVHVGQIDVTLGLNTTTEALRVENGTTDVMLDNLPTNIYLGIYNNPRFATYFQHFTSIEDNYVALNMKKAPFTNLLVREAAAYAVDRSQVLRAISGLGSVLTQIEAPGMPGFDPSLKALPYDPQKARALLAQAGHPGGKGLPTIIFADATDGYTAGPNVAQVVQQDLEQVGFKVQIKLMAPGAFLSSIGQYPLTMGIYGLDYPDPYDLIASQFLCSEIAAGNNWQYYCNPSIDKALSASLALPLGKAIPVYRRLQAQILAAFPWIPLYYPTFWYLVNPRIGNFGVHPTWPTDFQDWTIKG